MDGRQGSVYHPLRRTAVRVSALTRTAGTAVLLHGESDTSPLLETRSFRSPAIHLIEADYSAYSRFNTGLEEPPEQLRPLIPDWKPGQPINMTNIRLIMEEHRDFRDSRDEIGLQMADVMTNAAARALKGNLQKAAWRDFGRVMLQQFNRNEIIGLVRFHPQDRYWKQTPPYNEVLAHLRRTASPLLVI